jgi:dihydrodipicolinate synthase/N-acetylneuraminate lyase
MQRKVWLMSSRREIRGVLPVLSTPFNLVDEIDDEILRAEISWVMGQGADGVTTGMVSEILRISSKERMQLHEKVAGATLDLGGLVVLSAGAESTKHAIEYVKHAETCHADAAMVNPPISTSLGDEEIFGHYSSILDATEIAVIVQDASGYVGRPLAIDVQIKLLNNYGERVYFKPEAVPIGPRLATFMDATGGEARVFEGTGGAALVETFQNGVVGTMPGADLTWVVVALWEALKTDNWNQVDLLSGPLANLVNLQHSLDAYLAVEKHLLVRQGIFTSERVREPVSYRLTDRTRREVDRLFDLLHARVFATHSS